MSRKFISVFSLLLITTVLLASSAFSQIGTRFPSERKVIKDPVTGTELIFLTSKPYNDAKIYQTHPQWTADGEWIVFRSDRVPGEAMAVNEKSGEIVQVTEGGYSGMLNLSQRAMKLYFIRIPDNQDKSSGDRPAQVIEVALGKLFTDIKSGDIKSVTAYERICGTIPAEIGAGGDMALDATDEFAYFRVGSEEAARHLPPGTRIAGPYGPHNRGAGPSGIASINIKTGELRHVISVPFQVGHIQANQWVPGEIVFCWETGGKAPQRTWTVKSDGTGLRPLYPESDFEWVTHEVIITRDEVAFAIGGDRKVNPNVIASYRTEESLASQQLVPEERVWGPAGTREKPSGLGIVNIRTREMIIIGQTDSGSGFWHVNGSADGRWATGDDFSRSIYLIDRRSREMKMISTGHKPSAADHPHPSFSPDGTKIHIQSAMISEDNRSLNICIIPLPEEWLNR